MNPEQLTLTYDGRMEGALVKNYCQHKERLQNARTHLNYNFNQQSTWCLIILAVDSIHATVIFI